MDRSSALSLSNIRDSLIRQEDTIIFSLIERSQFSLNAPVYNQGEIIKCCIYMMFYVLSLSAVS